MVLTAGVVVLASAYAEARGLYNVPLRNFGGFSIFHHWSYDAVERLVLAGLADRRVLNTKPLTRIEMARIVAAAMEKVRDENDPVRHRRRDLEPTLYALVDEFKPELADLGVEPYSLNGTVKPALSVQPFELIESRGGWASDEVKLENAQGRSTADGIQGQVSLLSRAEWQDTAAVSLNPEVRVDKDSVRLRLHEGYLKVAQWGMSLQAGRESISWGPGFHGSLLFSNNAEPLEHVRFDTDAFVPPWYFRYLGPTKLTFLLGRLEEDRDFPRAKVAAWRVDISPFPFLEFGVSGAIQFGGEGREISFDEIPEFLDDVFTQQSGTDKFNHNDLFAIDATLRFANVDRILPIGRDLALYTEIGADIGTGGFLPEQPAFMVGTYITSPFGLSETDWRVEYAQTSTISFTHEIYTSGFSIEGRPLSHFIGTDGKDVYSRFSWRPDPDFLLGLEGGYAEIGTTVKGSAAPREERLFGGFDLSYRVTPKRSIFFAFHLYDVDNVNFISGNDKLVPSFQFGATYEF